MEILRTLPLHARSDTGQSGPVLYEPFQPATHTTVENCRQPIHACHTSAKPQSKDKSGTRTDSTAHWTKHCLIAPRPERSPRPSYHCRLCTHTRSLTGPGSQHKECTVCCRMSEPTGLACMVAPESVPAWRQSHLARS